MTHRAEETLEADDFRDNARTTGTVGGSVTGDIERPVNRFRFAVDPEAGKTCRFDMKGSAMAQGAAGCSRSLGPSRPQWTEQA
ncbi:MAG: hypothetical protein OXE57_12015 [Alphaproteobacteria bacterium]|nr:hypothetical protein [Alphaproteobacteria bacterium]